MYSKAGIFGQSDTWGKSMHKVAIVTIISKNYGNCLQYFALQEAPIRLDNQVKTTPAYPYHAIRYFYLIALRSKNICCLCSDTPLS